MRVILPFVLLLAGCAAPLAPPANRPEPLQRDLADVFDCLREQRRALVSAHRGQPDPTRAENARSSFADSVAAGPLILEIDIARTADGALLLLHDDRLDRTTTGQGLLRERTAAELAGVRLRDSRGAVLDEGLPGLAETLAWARRAGVLLQLDLKRGVPRADVVAAVRAADMAGQVILIAYDLAGVQEFATLAPDMMISGSGANAAEWQALLAMAQDHPRLLGFTGVSEPEPSRIAAMDAVGMEAITGTLGRAGQRLDDRYMADGDGREYADLAASGVALIASDRPLDAWAALKAAGRDGTICLKEPR